MEKGRVYFFFTCLLISFSVRSHSPTEIGFELVSEQKETYLDVHLTGITLFDLLYHLYPELKSQASLNLSNYTAEYEAYFNQNLNLILNKNDFELRYEDANLTGHDSSLRFLIVGLKTPISKYHVSVGGFDFYNDPKFTLSFDTESISARCFLTKLKNSCSGEISESHTTNKFSYWWLILIIPALSFLNARRLFI